MLFSRRLGGDETNWADRLGIVKLVEERLKPAPFCYQCRLNTQQRIFDVLWLLGLTLSSDLRAIVDVPG